MKKCSFRNSFIQSLGEGLDYVQKNQQFLQQLKKYKRKRKIVLR